MKFSQCLTIFLLTADLTRSAPLDFTISGIVVDTNGNQPIRHVTVTATGWDTVLNRASRVLVTRTDEDGKFAFAGLPENTFYDIQAKKAGYIPVPDERDRRNVKSSKSVMLQMFRKATLTITVKNASGFPVVGAEIAFAGQGENKFETAFFRLPTNQDGIFREALWPGAYRFVLLAPSSGTLLCAQGLTFRPRYYPGTEDVNHADSIDLSSGKDVSVEIRVNPTAAREIHAHLAMDGKLVNVFVSGTVGGVTRGNWGLVQNEEGSRDIRISNLPEGTYVLQFDLATSSSITRYVKTVQVIDKPVTDVAVSPADRKQF